MSNELQAFSLKDLDGMALAVANSGLWPQFNSKEKAIGLMLLCQSEGLHPMEAVKQYDLIQGRPALKSEAQLSKFYSRGGKVKWITRDNSTCEAVFFSISVPDGVPVKWTIEDARVAGLLGKETWRKHPRQMLSARVQAEGVQIVDPAASLGLLNTEEARDAIGLDFDKAAEASEILTGSKPENADVISEESVKTDTELRKIRATLNKRLLACNTEEDVRLACNEFQKEHGLFFWNKKTCHNDFETFTDVAKQRLEAIADPGKRLRETNEKGDVKSFLEGLAMVGGPKALLGFVAAYDRSDELKTTECEDALQAKAKEIGLEHYTEVYQAE